MFSKLTKFYFVYIIFLVSMMGTYSDLLKEIKYYSESKFKGIYSKAFTNHVILPSHHPKKKQFSIVYGDFNRLNDINSIYSKQSGDDILSHSYSKIQEILEQYFPKKDYSISMIGGDEFLVTIESIDEQRIHDCLKKIQAVLHSGSLEVMEHQYDDKVLKDHLPEFIDFSYGIVLSNEKDFDSIYEMLHVAENRQSYSKIFSEDSENDFYASLEKYANRSLSNFFKNFRLNNYFHFDIASNIKNNKKDIRDLLLLAVNSSMELLQDSDKISNLNSKLKLLDINPSIKPSSLLLDEQCEEIYSYMQNGSPDDITYLKHFNINELSSFLNVLIREPVSGCYNRMYFDKYFSNFFNRADTSFTTALLVDTTNMKDSNLKLGHIVTDEKMKLFSNQLQNNFESLMDMPFSRDNFNFSPDDNIIFDFGGGDYLIFFKDFMDKDMIHEILEKSIQNCEPLSFVSTSENIKGITNLNYIVNNLYANCGKKKHSLKKDYLNFAHTNIAETFHLFLAPTLEYYLQNHPSNPFDMTELKKFSHLISVSTIEQASRNILYANHAKKSDSKEY